MNSTTDRREYHLVLSEKYYNYMAIFSSYQKTVIERIEKRFPPEDLEKFDVEIANSLKQILGYNKEVLEELLQPFECKGVPLIKGGFDIFVDESNKREYVNRVIEYKLTLSIEKQIKLENFITNLSCIKTKEISKECRKKAPACGLLRPDWEALCRPLQTRQNFL
jgi:hypothetical protein